MQYIIVSLFITIVSSVILYLGYKELNKKEK